MNQNDLDILLAEFRGKQPGDLRARKWKNAVQAELKKSQPVKANRAWLQLIAAMVVGFIIGGMYFQNKNTESDLLAKNYSSGDATYDYSYTKSE